MINAIIFSKDRASQLNLFLNSVEKNAKNIFELRIIYTYSDEIFGKGYDKLIKKYPEAKWFRQSSDFKQDVLTNLETNNNYTTFFTDDDIIYRAVNEEEMISKLKSDKDSFCFSMRLGLNVNKCYTMKCDNVIIPDFESDKFISWNWQVHLMDFGYPLSVDGHIFRTEEISKLTKRVTFKDPNSYEGGLQIFNNFPKKNMWSYKTNALVNSPSNIVQSTSLNRNGEKHGISAKDLNSEFLNDNYIDLNKIDFSNIVGCHQELELPLFNGVELKEK
jgi:hypothetical protein